MSHEFELRKQIALDATPEQVWDAIATGPGIDAWFMGRNEVEPGAATRLTMGGHTEESTVTGWEPGKRFAHRTAEGPTARSWRWSTSSRAVTAPARCSD